MTATETTVTVQRVSGTPACIDIAYGEVDAWDTRAEGRLLGIGISGHEYNSYLLVDRNTGAAPVETGVKPVFSPSGRRFARQHAGRGGGRSTPGVPQPSVISSSSKPRSTSAVRVNSSRGPAPSVPSTQRP